MELLIVLAGLAVLFFPVAVLFLISASVRLSRRVRRLETDLAELRAQSPEATEPQDAPAANAPVAEAQAEDAAAPSDDVTPAPEAAISAVSPWERIASGRAIDAAPPPKTGPGLGDWLVRNWVYALSAASLALAGLFLVQYGVEAGLITPTLRILLAMALGAGLIVAGERIRRRSGDEADRVTAYLPSTFSGAGLVTLYGAVIGAQQLYGLTGPGATLLGLTLVSAMALVFGWFYGPFLAAIGLIGGAAAPFLVGGESDTPWIFYIYFGALGLVGLAIDGLRRWGWTSWLALAAAIAPGALLMLSGAGRPGYALLLTAMALGALALPRMERRPAHDGVSVLIGPAQHRPIGGVARETLLAWAGVGAAVVGLIWLSEGGVEAGLTAAALLTVLSLAQTVWARRAEALVDLAWVPGLGIAALALYHGAAGIGLAAPPQPHPETGLPTAAFPPAILVLMALATLSSLALAWRSSVSDAARPFLALGAAVTAPSLAVAIELTWNTAPYLSDGQWALAVVALGAAMVVLAERFAAADPPDDRRRTAYATLAALSLIALALFVLLTQAALTVALAVLVVAASALDRRFSLPEMGLFAAAGVLVLTWRLVVLPGVPFALDGPVPEVVLSFGAALGAMAAGLAILRPLDRPFAKTFLESGLFSLTGIFACLMVYRWIVAAIPGSEGLSHWSATLFALIWLALAAAQLYRQRLGGSLTRVRTVLAVLYGTAALAGLAASVGPLNPVLNAPDSWAGRLFGTRILGPWPFDTLLLAYGVPGLVLLGASRRLPSRRRTGARAIGAVLAIVWVALAIRRFWQDGVSLDLGLSDPELYSYTVALVLLGAALLYQAIAKGDVALRRLAMTVIGLTAAKVFLIDAAGLDGLLRVASFLGFGLALAGLAWLNRWATQAGSDGAEDDHPA